LITTSGSVVVDVVDVVVVVVDVVVVDVVEEVVDEVVVVVVVEVDVVVVVVTAGIYELYKSNISNEFKVLLYNLISSIFPLKSRDEEPTP